MKDKWAKAKKAGFKNLSQAKLAKNPMKMVLTCDDCTDRPKWLLEDLDFTFQSKQKLCNRHFFLFTNKFQKWFIEDKIELV